MSLDLALIFILVITLASFAQAVTGFGFSILSIPLLAMFMSAADAIVSATISSFFLTAAVALRQRHSINLRVLLKVSILAAMGMPLGILILRDVSERWIIIAIVCVVLASVVMSSNRRVVVPQGIPLNGFLAVIGGSMLTSTGLNGPPMVLLAYRVEQEAGRARALMQALFAVQDLIAIGIFWFAGFIRTESLVVTGQGLLGLVFGWVLGNWLFRRLSSKVIRRIMVTGLCLVSVQLGLRAIFVLN